MQNSDMKIYEPFHALLDGMNRLQEKRNMCLISVCMDEIATVLSNLCSR